jgi:phosphohistidine swiveling domain-containing protein
MPEGPRGVRELDLTAARDLDGIWVAAGISDAPGVPPTPLAAELVFDDVELLWAALDRRGASASRRARRLVSLDGFAFQPFLPLARAASELVPLDGEGLALAIACEAREDIRRAVRRRAVATRAGLALLVTRIVRGVARLETRVRAHEQDASQHYRWLVEMDLGILPDDALRTTISECVAIQRASRSLELSATLDLLGGYAALFALSRRAEFEESEQFAAAALVPEPLELASVTPALALLSALHAAPASNAAEVHARIADYVAGYGDRGPCEREPFTPRWAESIPALERALALLQRVDLRQREARRVEAAHARAERLARAVMAVPLLERMPLKALLGALQRLVLLRSRLHLVRARTLYMLRTATLDVDRRLRRLIRSEPGTAFFLRLRELTESTWRPDPRHIEAARERQTAWLVAREKPSPPAVLGRDVEPRSANGTLQGVGLGVGEVTGQAKLARDFSAALSLEPGAVLVARSLDPGWAPILSAAAAVVTDVGGLTDEGVLAAGALGVPLVIGVRDALSQIRDGERLHVDPRAGTVTRA